MESKQMYTVECGISYVTLGTAEVYSDALEMARRKHRFEFGYNTVWDSDNVKVAQVWVDGLTWEKR